MISLSYHYHNNRRREKEALERKANKERKSTDITDEFGSNKNLTMSPRQMPKAKMQKNIHHSSSNQTQNRTITTTTTTTTTVQTKKLVMSGRKPDLSKALSFDNNNSTKPMVTSQSVDDLDGFVTVRDTTSVMKTVSSGPKLTLGPKPLENEEMTVGHCRSHGGLENLGHSLMSTNRLMKQICLVEPEKDEEVGENVH